MKEKGKLIESPQQTGESEVSIAKAKRLFRKLEACSSLSAKLILLRQFCDKYAADLREYTSSPQVTPPKYDPSWHGSQAHTFVTDKPVGSEVKPRTGDKS